MRLNFTNRFSWITILALAIVINFAFAGQAVTAQNDTTYLHLLKAKTNKNTFKNSLHLVLPPLKPAFISTTKINVVKSDDRILSNVQVYPNPVTDQINIKYELSHNAAVTIKLMDILGNDIIPLFSQRLEHGEQNFSYALNGKLTQGFYFVRIIAGTESVIKRISVL